jgi:hypothetical protein
MYVAYVCRLSGQAAAPAYYYYIGGLAAPAYYYIGYTYRLSGQAACPPI